VEHIHLEMPKDRVENCIPIQMVLFMYGGSRRVVHFLPTLINRTSTLVGCRTKRIKGPLVTYRKMDTVLFPLHMLGRKIWVQFSNTVALHENLYSSCCVSHSVTSSFVAYNLEHLPHLLACCETPLQTHCPAFRTVLQHGLVNYRDGTTACE
jgi:hypothetical protein